MVAEEPATSFSCKPYAYREARAIADALGLSEPVAITLVRRGYRTPEQAREFLAAEETHDPFEFESMAAVCAELASAIQQRKRITVHGDYDVDGVCSTAILVRTLKALGADCDWLIPARSDGYGLTTANVELLAGRGTDVLLTADCGIGCAQEIELARSRGVETIVTDHHQPPERLPDCPIVHPALSGYPFADLCAAGVAHKLSHALRSKASLPQDPVELQLVALATVADVVPLVGENRRLVRDGLAEARRSPLPGLQALTAVSKTDPATLSSGDLGFRVAPRINAAGRLYRADAGVELFLTDDPDRAREIAVELDRANAERRAVEREVLSSAEREFAASEPAHREAPAIVLAGEGWHPGVVGIVASRLAERYWRPVVLIGLADGRGRGSARSIPGFDLVAGLEACSGHLARYGGHVAAAGLELAPEAVPAFREDFIAHAREAITPEQLVRERRMDAVVGIGAAAAGGVGIDLAEEFERLAPFGAANPEPRLLVPAARLREVRAMGETEKHARFQVESGAGRALGVAFNVGSTLERLEGAHADLSISLEVDRWNGSVAPRLILDTLRPLPNPPEQLEEPACTGAAAGDEWWDRFEAELSAPLGPWSGSHGLEPALERARTSPERTLIDRRGGAAVAAIAELVSSGGSVLAVCADAARRKALVDRYADGDGPEPGVCCHRCAELELQTALARTAAPGGIALADWGALLRFPRWRRASTTWS